MKTHFCKEATRPFSLQRLLNGFEAHIWALIKVITFDLWVGKIPWRREMLPTPVSGLENSKDCISSWGCKELDLTEWFHCRFQVALVKDPPANAGDVRDVVRKMPWRGDRLPTPIFLGFPGGSDCKESSCNEGDLGLLPGLGRSPGDGHDNPFHYSCLENPTDRGACWVTVHRVAKKSDTIRSDLAQHTAKGITVWSWGPSY